MAARLDSPFEKNLPKEIFAELKKRNLINNQSVVLQNLYNNFIGIDIGKTEFVSFLNSDTKTNCYKSNNKGFQKFFNDHKNFLTQSLVVLETTGGHETACLNFLLDSGVAPYAQQRGEKSRYRRTFGGLEICDQCYLWLQWEANEENKASFHYFVKA